MKKTYTDKQGQYLAFIHYYSKIHGCSPSEAEMQQYFLVSPPAVHQMVLTLEARGLIARGPDPADRRGTLVTLTRAGLATIDTIEAEHVANETRLVGALSPNQRDTLVHLLRKLLLALELD